MIYDFWHRCWLICGMVVVLGGAVPLCAEELPMDSASSKELTLDATSAREFVKALRTNAHLLQAADDESSPVLFIYQGKEKLVEFSNDPSVTPLSEGLDNRVMVAPVTPIYHKSIHALIGGGIRSVSGVEIRKSLGGQIVWVVEPAEVGGHMWPLTLPLDKRAGREMTCQDVVELLRDVYYWHDPDLLVGDRTVFRFCDECGTGIIWEGKYEGKVAADLLEALLLARHKSISARYPKTPFSFQVTPTVVGKDGDALGWTILTF